MICGDWFRVKGNVDWRKLITGLVFASIGAAAVGLSSTLQFGNAVRLGPGAFPVVLGCLLVFMGVAHIFAALRGKEGKPIGSLVGKAAILIPLSAVAFGVTIDRFGLIPAAIVTTVIACLGNPKVVVSGVVVMTLLLTGFAVVVFYFGLALPFPLLRGL